MCYILYASVNEGINEKDYEAVTSSSDYTFKIGTKHDLKECIINQTYEYRITKAPCDCDHPVGMHDPQAKGITVLSEAIRELRNIRGIKCVYMSKTWTGKHNKKEITVHIDDVDLPTLLADMENSCLYRIDLYPKFT